MPGAAQLTVFDPVNQQQNLLSAARALQQINNQVRQLQADAQMLSRMDQNLARLKGSITPDLQRTLDAINGQLRQGNAIALSLKETEMRYARLFPKHGLEQPLERRQPARGAATLGGGIRQPAAGRAAARRRSPMASPPMGACSAKPWTARDTANRRLGGGAGRQRADGSRHQAGAVACKACSRPSSAPRPRKRRAISPTKPKHASASKPFSAARRSQAPSARGTETSTLHVKDRRGDRRRAAEAAFVVTGKAMDDLAIIDRFTETFSRYIDSGFGLIAGDVAFLTSTLVGIDITLAGLFWALLGEDHVIAQLIRKVLYVGFFALADRQLQEPGRHRLCTPSPGLASRPAAARSDRRRSDAAGLRGRNRFYRGAAAAGGRRRARSASPPSSPTSSPSSVLLLAWLIVLIAFFVMSVQLFITIIEFKLTVLAGFVLVPFALFGHTTFLAERVLGNVISSGHQADGAGNRASASAPRCSAR